MSATILHNIPTACDVQALGARLRALRKEAGLTQAAVAHRLGTTQSAIARLEAGHKGLSIRTVRRVATALDCEVTVMIAGREGVVV